MSQAIITLAYKQVIDSNFRNAFEQYVWNSSYHEYLLKSQAYNTGYAYKSFAELKAHDGRANSLHYKCGFAADGFIRSLNGQIPYLTDNHGEPVAFTNYEFQVISTNIDNKQQHVVAIIYKSGPLVLQSVISNYLLLSIQGHAGQQKQDGTFMIALQPMLSISTYEEIFVLS